MNTGLPSPNPQLLPPDVWDPLPDVVKAFIVTLTADNAALRTLVARQQACIVELEALAKRQAARISELEATVERQAARIAELEARLGLNSRNSSRPPSSDAPFAGRRPATRRPPSGRKPGGQPGHKGHHRQSVPPEQVDQVVEHRPEVCRGCASELGPDLPTTGEPVRLQQTELPPVRPLIIEHHYQAVRCPHCGLVNKAAGADAVVHAAFGPRLEAVIALLAVVYRASRRAVVTLCRDLFGIRLSTGAVQAGCQRVSEAVARPVDELKQVLPRQPVVHADETGWRQRGLRRWLWTVVAPAFTIFVIATSRAGQVLREMLGADFKGFVVSDRWSGYAWLAPAQRQVCWAHLKRDFQGLIDRGGQAEPAGRWLMRELDALFVHWRRWRAGDIDRASLRRYLLPVRMRLRRALDRGACSTDRKAVALCKNLLRLWQSLFTFTCVPGVEPTNNAAERALRPAVQHRKTSFGTQSDAGARFFERLMTVSASCRQQGRDVLAFLVASVEAARHGRAPPTLLAADAEHCPVATPAAA